MQIILASAKIMNDKLKSIPDISLSLPCFQKEADCFARDMVQYSADTIAEMLGCSLLLQRNTSIFLTGSVSVKKSESFSLCSTSEKGLS